MKPDTFGENLKAVMTLFAILFFLLGGLQIAACTVWLAGGFPDSPGKPEVTP